MLMLMSSLILIFETLACALQSHSAPGKSVGLTVAPSHRGFLRNVRALLQTLMRIASPP